MRVVGIVIGAVLGLSILAVAVPMLAVLFAMTLCGAAMEFIGDWMMKAAHVGVRQLNETLQAMVRTTKAKGR